nr:hypothetical protein CFP56_68158 [Quercus suber]
MMNEAFSRHIRYAERSDFNLGSAPSSFAVLREISISGSDNAYKMQHVGAVIGFLYRSITYALAQAGDTAMPFSKVEKGLAAEMSSSGRDDEPAWR